MSKLAHDPDWLEVQRLKAHFKIKYRSTYIFGGHAYREGDEGDDSVWGRNETEAVLDYASVYDLEIPEENDPS